MELGFDARTLPNGAELACDVCIVGAGPAGLALASEFSGKNYKVTILDSGSMTEARDELGALSDGARIGDVEEITQIHRVGGNAHAWNVRTPGGPRNVRFGTYKISDMPVRAPLGIEQWPISDAELWRYHQRAADFWKLPPEPQTSGKADILDAGPDAETSFYQFADSRTLLDGVRSRVAADENIQLLTFAQALKLEFTDDSRSASALNASSMPGHAFRIRARHYVLATGCINTTRLLLSSPTPAGYAPGNRHDLLGRYFMDHPLVDGGVFRPNAPYSVGSFRAYDIHSREGGVAMAHFHISKEALERENLPDMSVILIPRAEKRRQAQESDARQRAAHAAALAIRASFERRERPKLSDFMTAARGFDEVASKAMRRILAPEPNLGSGGWSKLGDPQRRFQVFELLHIVEQAPHADNRIYLSNEANALGQRRCGISWRWHDEDQRALMRSQQLFAKSVRDAGLGAIEIPSENGKPKMVTASTGHHMGATRMHADPERGVVDLDCRVHGTDNLYVASSSVFPSGGYLNPTFTTTALSIRIADCVQKRLRV